MKRQRQGQYHEGQEGNNYYEEEWSDDSWNTEASWDTES